MTAESTALAHFDSIRQPVRDGKLTLSRHKMTDDDWRHLENLTNLREVWLNSDRTTDDDIGPAEKLEFAATTRHLQQRRRRAGIGAFDRVAEAGSAKITDKGLAELGNLAQLRHLSLHRSHITDAGLECFAGLTELSQSMPRRECRFTSALRSNNDAILQSSRGDRTSIELLMAGVRGWEAGLRQYFHGK